MTKSNIAVTAVVKRGPESWTYIYTVLGFVVTIESTVIGMLTPLAFPWNILVFLALAAATTWLCLESGWFQNKLIGFKIRYEEKAR